MSVRTMVVAGGREWCVLARCAIFRRNWVFVYLGLDGRMCDLQRSGSSSRVTHRLVGETASCVSNLLKTLQVKTVLLAQCLWGPRGKVSTVMSNTLWGNTLNSAWHLTPWIRYSSKSVYYWLRRLVSTATRMYFPLFVTLQTYSETDLSIVF